MPDVISFDLWWQEFSIEHNGDKDGGYAAVDDLLSYVRALPADKRTAFLDGLVTVVTERNRPARSLPGVALEVLQSEAEPRQIQVICRHVASLQNKGSDDRLTGLVKVLASDSRQQCQREVERYLSAHSAEDFDFFVVAWALWPHNPALFAEAIARYYSSAKATNYTATNWTRAAESLLTRPAAIPYVKASLRKKSEENWERLRTALLAVIAARPPYLAAYDLEPVSVD